MDIKLPHSLLRQYLETNAAPKDIAKCLTLCGPSVDKLHQIGNDWVYDIEVITNRVDTASAYGIAREANAILPQFGFNAKLINDPRKLSTSKLSKPAKNLPLNVQILDQSLVPHFAAIILDNITVKSSPTTIKRQLEMIGERAISNLVDITNYLTLCFGQPTHIFDYDKIGEHAMKVRSSNKGETITTLDGKTHKLHGNDIIIEDGSGRLIDLCGIMGGENSQVDKNTKRAILFVQTYEPRHIRSTSLYTQERSLASQIFEKQPDSQMVIPTLIAGHKLLQQHSGATLASKLINIDITPNEPRPLHVDLRWLNHIIGTNIKSSQIRQILKILDLPRK